MFDLRYHVASLAAVFVALAIGILVGVGISGRGLVDDLERDRLNGDIAELRDELDAARDGSEQTEAERRAASEAVRRAFPLLAADRLDGQRVAVVFVGSVDPAVASAIDGAVGAGGGNVSSIRSIEAPIDDARLESMQRSLRGNPELAGYAGERQLDQLGRAIGRELALGDETPLLDMLGPALVEQASGDARRRVDGVVVVRSADPQAGPTGRFVKGLYSGLGSAGVPAVGVEAADAEPTAVPAFSGGGLSTVRGIDEPFGRLALVLLLAGGEPGDYGADAEDAVPEIEPLPPDQGE